MLTEGTHSRSVDLVLTRNREAKGKGREIQRRQGKSLPRPLSVVITAVAAQQLVERSTTDANVHAVMYKEEEHGEVKEQSTNER